MTWDHAEQRAYGAEEAYVDAVADRERACSVPDGYLASRTEAAELILEALSADSTIDGALRALAGLMDCCTGAAVYGPTRCTCWVTEYDLVQQPVEPGLVVGVHDRAKMCDACAYRPDSPEARGDPRYQGRAPDGATFWCHEGMRKVARWRHPGLGITVEADGDYYQPPMVKHRTQAGRGEAVPFKADGSPGERCAGWAAHQGRDRPRG